MKRIIEAKFTLADQELIIDSNNFDIKFTLEQDKTSHSNVLTLTIYNIHYDNSQDNILTVTGAFLALKPTIALYAGYEEEISDIQMGSVVVPKTLLFTGQLVQVLPAYDELDISYSLVAMQERDIWTNTIFNCTFPKGYTARKIITELIDSIGSYTTEDGTTIKLEIGELILTEIPYEQEFSKSNTTLQEILGDIAKDQFCHYYIDKGKLNFYPYLAYLGYNSGKSVEELSTMIEYKDILKIETTEEDGFKITTKFKPFEINSLIKVSYVDLTDYILCISKINFSCECDDGDFQTEIEVEELHNYGEKQMAELEERKKKSEEDLAKQAEKNKKAEEKASSVKVVKRWV